MLNRNDLEGHGRKFWLAVAAALVAVLGYIDYATGYEMGFSLFYLIPIVLVSWYSTRRLALVVSILSAAAWMTADIADGHRYSHPALYAWNTLIRLGFFVVVAMLLSALRAAHDRMRELARTDYLTGLSNGRRFVELTELEFARAGRYRRPFALVYVDLDNFKELNDRLGHVVGDETLVVVGQRLLAGLRRTDIVARIGGDEFVALLPETAEEAARAAVAKLHAGLTAGMTEHGWPVTFSIGVMTFFAPPVSVTEAVRAADELMYTAKRGRKGSVMFATQGA